MKCEFSEELLQLYALGEATADQRAQVEEHLAECAYCRQRIIYLRRVDMLVAAMPVVSPAMEANLVQVDKALRSHMRPPRRRQVKDSQVRRIVGTAVAALAVVVIAGALLFTLPRSQGGILNITSTGGPNQLAANTTPPSAETLLKQALAQPTPVAARTAQEMDIKGQGSSGPVDIAIFAESAFDGQDSQITQTSRGLPASYAIASARQIIIKSGVTYVNLGGSWESSGAVQTDRQDVMIGLISIPALVEEIQPLGEVKLAGQRDVRGELCEVVAFDVTPEGRQKIAATIVATAQTPVLGQTYKIESAKGELAIDANRAPRQVMLTMKASNQADPQAQYELTYVLTSWDLNSPDIEIEAPGKAPAALGTPTPIRLSPTELGSLAKQIEQTVSTKIVSLRTKTVIQNNARVGQRALPLYIKITSDEARQDAHLTLEVVNMLSSAFPPPAVEIIMKDTTGYQKKDNVWGVADNAVDTASSLSGLSMLRAVPTMLQKMNVISYNGQTTIDGTSCDVYGFSMGRFMTPEIAAAITFGTESQQGPSAQNSQVSGEIAVAADHTVRQLVLKVDASSSDGTSERFQSDITCTFSDLNSSDIVISAPTLGGRPATPTPRPPSAIMLDGPANP